MQPYRLKRRTKVKIYVKNTVLEKIRVKFAAFRPQVPDPYTVPYIYKRMNCNPALA